MTPKFISLFQRSLHDIKCSRNKPKTLNSTLDSSGLIFFSRCFGKSDGHAQKVLLSSQTEYRPLLRRSFSRRHSGRFIKNARREKYGPGIEGFNLMKKEF